MKYFKIIAIIVGILILGGLGGWIYSDGKTEAQGAPSSDLTYEKTILPIADSLYDLGTSTQKWRNIYVDSCTGCGGGSSVGAMTDLTDVTLTSTSTGDVLYNDATGKWVNLGAGSNGQVLKLSAGIPSWGTDDTSAGGGEANQIATSSAGVQSSLLYYTTSGATPELVDPVATTSLTLGTNLSYSGTLGAVVGGIAGDLTIDDVYVLNAGDTMTGGLVFSGVATDITTVGAENLTLQPSGAGVLDLSAGSGGVSITTSSGNSDITLDPHGTGDLILTDGFVSQASSTIASHLNVSDYINLGGTVSPAYRAGSLFYNDVDDVLEFQDSNSSTLLQIGQEDLARVYNNSGSQINNGQVVYINGFDAGGLNTIALSKADVISTARFSGVATANIANNATGTIATYGYVNMVDTSAFSVGDDLYVSTTTAGALTNLRPTAPYDPVYVGAMREDSATGSFFVDDGEGPAGIEASVVNIYNGTVVESPSIEVTSDGSVITLAWEKSGGGDLTGIIDGTFVYLDTTPATTTALTAGSDTSPQINYVYYKNTTVNQLEVSLTGFPTTFEFIPVGTFLCPSASLASTDGCYKEHQWNDHLATSVNQGHLSDLNAWVRNQNATWLAGVATTPTGGANTFDISTTAGTVLQLHSHAFPAIDTSGTDSLYVVNDSSTAYKKVGNLTQEILDANGVSMSGKSYNIVIWGSVNEVASTSKMYVNLPAASYNNVNQATDDSNRTSNYTIPSEFKGTGFLVARVIVTNSGGAGGTFTMVDTIDLRGQEPSIFAGGVAGSVTEFEDNTFKLLDNGDITKVGQFQISGVTTGTTRTLTFPDASGTMCLLEASQTFTGLQAFSNVGTTTFTGGIETAEELDVNGTATSTFANGIDLSAGCFSVLGVCVGGDVDQNIWLTVAGDTGSTAANTTTDTLTIAGGTNATTVMSGDSLTVNVDDAFLLNTGDIGTGVFDFGGATSFEAVNSSNPVLTVLGQFGFDTTDGTLLWYDGTAERVIAHDIYQANFTIYADDSWDNEEVPIWISPKDMAITVVQVDSVVFGTNPSLDWQLEERAFGSATTTGTTIIDATETTTDFGVSTTTFSNAELSTKAHIVFTTGASAETNTVDLIQGVIYYRKDVE
jgi:hypothetical protein